MHTSEHYIIVYTIYLMMLSCMQISPGCALSLLADDMSLFRPVLTVYVLYTIWGISYWILQCDVKALVAWIQCCQHLLTRNPKIFDENPDKCISLTNICMLTFRESNTDLLLTSCREIEKRFMTAWARRTII